MFAVGRERTHAKKFSQKISEKKIVQKSSKKPIKMDQFSHPRFAFPQHCEIVSTVNSTFVSSIDNFKCHKVCMEIFVAALAHARLLSARELAKCDFMAYDFSSSCSAMNFFVSFVPQSRDSERF